MSIPSWARKGAKVVCIDSGPKRGADGLWHSPRPGKLVQGAEYTIRGVVDDEHDTCLLLKETRQSIVVHRGRLYFDVGFILARFRPVVDDKSDNEIEAQIYRKKVHQNAAPRKVSERA